MTSAPASGYMNALGPIAQLVEPPAHNRQVPGSSPGGPTNTSSAKVRQGSQHLGGLCFYAFLYSALVRQCPLTSANFWGVTFNCQINHMQTPRNNYRLSSKPGKPVTLTAIVPFDTDCPIFSLKKIVFPYLQRINLPFVRTVKPDFPLCQMFHQSVESSLITPSTFPVDELAGITQQPFQIQSLSFDVRKCRICPAVGQTSP